MDYLFFDIEASEGRSMCSFGYVLTDENFRISEKEDILINPEARFCTQAYSKKKKDAGRGIELAYPEKVFYRSPAFPKRYDRIKQMLEKKDRMIIGFSHVNDVRYLCVACRRYKLPFFSYSFFDVQDVYREYHGLRDQISLERIAAELEVDMSPYVLHKSDDDAEVSMLVAKAVCERSGLTLPQMMEKYARYVGETHDGEVEYDGVDGERALIKKARNACRGAVVSYGNNLKVRFVKGSKVAGKKFCAGGALEKDEWIFALKFIACLGEKGARYVSSVREADFYVVFDENEGEKGDRLYNLKKNPPKSGFRIIQKDEAFAMMEMTEEQIAAYTNPKIERIRTQTERYYNKILRTVAPELLPKPPKWQ